MSELEYTRRGQGEALLLVHGLGGDRSTWTPVLDELASRFDVIAVDLPGFGASPPLPAGVAPTASALARALAGLLDELGLDSVHTAGNSLGAWVALELALLGRARSVAAFAPAGMWSRPLGPRPELAVRRLGSLLGPLLGALMAPTVLRRRLLAAFVAHPERVPRAEAARMARAYVSAPGYAAANREMRAGRFSRAAEVDVPVTLAWSELDRLVRRRDPGIPGARQVVLRGSGHVPTWDDPARVIEVILATVQEPVHR
jgi:pimeloyl-ACP methyl ester carboxylesterase